MTREENDFNNGWTNPEILEEFEDDKGTIVYHTLYDNGVVAVEVLKWDGGRENPKYYIHESFLMSDNIET